MTLNGVTLNGPVFNDLRWNGQSRAGIAVCDPSPIQSIAPNQRAIVLPNGQRIALR